MKVAADESKRLGFMYALEEYLRHRFNYRTRACEKANGPTISVSRNAIDLYIRFKPAHYAVEFDRPLVIAQMYFRKSRRGPWHKSITICGRSVSGI